MYQNLYFRGTASGEAETMGVGQRTVENEPRTVVRGHLTVIQCPQAASCKQAVPASGARAGKKTPTRRGDGPEPEVKPGS